MKNYMKEINSTFSNQAIIKGGVGLYHTCWVGWEPPWLGWVKLNTDGCCKREFNIASGGGILRDNKGNWMGGFSIMLGLCAVPEAELWAMVHGVRLTREMGVRRLVVEVDALPINKWLNEKEKGSGGFRNL